MRIIHSLFLICCMSLLSGCFGSILEKRVETCPLQKGNEIEVGPTKSNIPKMEEVSEKVHGPIQIVCKKRGDVS